MICICKKPHAALLYFRIAAADRYRISRIHYTSKVSGKACNNCARPWNIHRHPDTDMTARVGSQWNWPVVQRTNMLRVHCISRGRWWVPSIVAREAPGLRVHAQTSTIRDSHPWAAQPCSSFPGLRIVPTPRQRSATPPATDVNWYYVSSARQLAARQSPTSNLRAPAKHIHLRSVCSQSRSLPSSPAHPHSRISRVRRAAQGTFQVVRCCFCSYIVCMHGLTCLVSTCVGAGHLMRALAAL